MHCTAFMMDEVLAWVDAFSMTTGLPPSTSMSLYAELCRFESVFELIQEISTREATFLRSDEMENPHLLEVYTHTFVAHQDEQLEARDSEAMQERNHHYRAVLEHHGFKPAFIKGFYERLSPTGDNVPVPFDVKSKKALVKAFVPDPFYPPRQMKTQIASPLDELRKIFGEIQLGSPMNPQGWLAVFRSLGLPICKGSINNAWSLGEPSFHIDDDADPIPVFIVGVVNPPYTPNPSLQKAERIVGEYLSSRQNRRGVLFTGPPVKVGENEEQDCVVFWGRVYSDEAWYPLILHPGSTTIDHIVMDGIEAQDGLDGLEVDSLKDIGGRLVKIFASQHLDPTEELMTRESASRSVH